MRGRAEVGVDWELRSAYREALKQIQERGAALLYNFRVKSGRYWEAAKADFISVELRDQRLYRLAGPRHHRLIGAVEVGELNLCLGEEAAGSLSATREGQHGARALRCLGH